MGMYNPAHPGEILGEDILKPLGLSITKAAEHLKVSRKTLSKIINGRGAITADMALRLEIVFKNPSADHWLRMQNSHDLWHLKQEELDLTPYLPDAA